jgi:hypothetical protein
MGIAPAYACAESGGQGLTEWCYGGRLSAGVRCSRAKRHGAQRQRASAHVGLAYQARWQSSAVQFEFLNFSRDTSHHGSPTQRFRKPVTTRNLARAVVRPPGVLTLTLSSHAGDVSRPVVAPA